MSAVDRVLTGAAGASALVLGITLLLPAQQVTAGQEDAGRVVRVALPPSAAERATIVRGRAVPGAAADVVAAAPLAATRKAVSDEHVQQDPFLTAVLRGRAHQVVREGPWTEFEGEGEGEIGTIREIRFTTPQDFPQAKWPAIRYDETSDTYARHGYEAALRGVQTLTLFIDAQKGVVGMQADEDAQEFPSPGNPRLNIVSDH